MEKGARATIRDLKIAGHNVVNAYHIMFYVLFFCVKEDEETETRSSVHMVPSISLMLNPLLSAPSHPLLIKYSLSRDIRSLNIFVASRRPPSAITPQMSSLSRALLRQMAAFSTYTLLAQFPTSSFSFICLSLITRF